MTSMEFAGERKSRKYLCSWFLSWLNLSRHAKAMRVRCSSILSQSPVLARLRPSCRFADVIVAFSTAIHRASSAIEFLVIIKIDGRARELSLASPSPARQFFVIQASRIRSGVSPGSTPARNIAGCHPRKRHQTQRVARHIHERLHACIVNSGYQGTQLAS
jgi:hypothetical protein